VSDAAFWDVGTTSDYWQTSRAFATAETGGKMPAGRGTRIGSSARVTRSILWDDVEVGNGCTVDECIVTDGVRVPAGSRHVRQVLVCGRDGQAMASPYD
jgi:NDP-sugar pyrophosphorylase family protein